MKENEISSNERNSSTCLALQKSNFEKILRKCIKSGITQQYGDNHLADEYASKYLLLSKYFIFSYS